MRKKQSKIKDLKRHSKFTMSFKQQVVEEVLSGKYTKEQVREIYGIKGKSVVLNWIRELQKKDNLDNENSINFDVMKKTLKEQRLLEELSKTKELLRIAELKAEMWQCAIKIAEKRFNIDIVKKFGAQALQQLKNKNHK